MGRSITCLICVCALQLFGFYGRGCAQNAKAPAEMCGLIPDYVFDATTVKKTGPYDLHPPIGLTATAETPFDLVQVARNSNDDVSQMPPIWWGNIDGGYDIHWAIVAIDIYPSVTQVSDSGLRLADYSLVKSDRPGGDMDKHSIHDLQLFHGDTEIIPIRTCTFPMIQRTTSTDQTPPVGPQEILSFYDPSAFDPSAPIVIKIKRTATQQTWEAFSMNPGIQRQIWNQFAGYRAVTNPQQASIAYNGTEAWHLSGPK